MHFGPGTQIIKNNELLQTGTRTIALLRDHVELSVPPDGSADVTLTEVDISVTLSGSGQFSVQTKRGSVSITATGDSSLTIEATGKGRAKVGGAVRLSTWSAFEVEARGRTTVELRDSGILRAYEETLATVSGQVKADIYDKSRVVVNGWARVTLHGSDAGVVGRPSPSARVVRLSD